MPDKDGRLSKEELNLIHTHLASIGAGRGGCPVCGHNEFSVADHLTEYRVFSNGSLRLSGPVYPAVLAACEKCSHIQTFLAIPILPALSEEAKRLQEEQDKKRQASAEEDKNG